MKNNIVIIGAGQVGGSLADQLSAEGNQVTVIDTDAQLLAQLRERLDIRTVRGRGPQPEVLEQAGIEDADILIAVTTRDEVNMMACQVAHSLFQTPRKIARIRSVAYTNAQTRARLFGKNHLPVDEVITPERLVTDNLVRLIAQPGALQVLDFADGRVQLVAARATAAAPMLGHELRDLKTHAPSAPCRVAAIYRDGKFSVPDADSRIAKGDEVFFLAASEHIGKVLQELAGLEKRYRRIMIVGGGNIGLCLAQELEARGGYRVKVVEQSKSRCMELAEQLGSTVVLHGSASDKDLLADEDVGRADVFLALTNVDAINIMSSMLAKKKGAGKVVALVNSPEYADLIQGYNIDIAISPHKITSGALLTLVRTAARRVHRLRYGTAEAIEMVARGSVDDGSVVGCAIRDLDMPPGSGIGAVVRQRDGNSEVMMGHGDLRVENDDHLILFLVDRAHLGTLEKLFAAPPTHF